MFVDGGGCWCWWNWNVVIINHASCGTSGRIMDRRKILARHNFDLAGKDLKLNFEFSAICSTAESVEKILKAKRYLRQIYWLRPSVVRTQPP